MRFPESPRIQFERNPLVEVICQVRFPRVPAVDTDAVTSYLDALRDTLVAQEVRDNIHLAVQPSTMSLQQTRRREHHCSNTAGDFHVVFSSESFALQVNAYDGWEHFAERWSWAFSRFVSQFQPSHATRIGLRYQDLIVRSDLGLEGAAWQDLIKPQVLPECLSDATQDWEGYEAILTRSLEHYAKAVLRLALVEPVPARANNEAALLVDTDCYLERAMKWEDTDALLRLFNREAGNAFRWCLKPPLFEALGPTPVEVPHA